MVSYHPHTMYLRFYEPAGDFALLCGFGVHPFEQHVRHLQRRGCRLHGNHSYGHVVHIYMLSCVVAYVVALLAKSANRPRGILSFVGPSSPCCKAVTTLDPLLSLPTQGKRPLPWLGTWATWRCTPSQHTTAARCFRNSAKPSTQCTCPRATLTQQNGLKVHTAWTLPRPCARTSTNQPQSKALPHSCAAALGSGSRQESATTTCQYYVTRLSVSLLL